MIDDPSTMRGVLVIGLGNPDRGDDGVGLLVARGVRAAAPQSDVVEVRDEAACLDVLRTGRNVVLVDAMRSGAEVGSIRRVDLDIESLPVSFVARSTHSVGLAHTIELARALNDALGHVGVYGIEGCSFDLGSTMSAEVERAADSVIDMILAELHQGHAPMGVGRA